MFQEMEMFQLFLCYYIYAVGIFTTVVGTQFGQNQTYTLDSNTVDLYYDLTDISGKNFFVLNIADGHSMDMFLIGSLTDALNIYELYAGSLLIGSMGNLSIYSGKINNRIPLKLTTSDKFFIIKNTRPDITISDTSLYFKLYDEHVCPGDYVIQSTTSGPALWSSEGVPVLQKETFSGAECFFKIIILGELPRTLIITDIKTDSTEDVIVTGGTYNQSLPYFTFNKLTANNFVNISLYGSVFTFHIQDQKKTQVTLIFYRIHDIVYSNSVYVTFLNQISILTSPFYGEAHTIFKAYSANFKIYSGIYSCNISDERNPVNFRFQLMNKNNFGSDTALYVSDSNNEVYSFIGKDLLTPIYVEDSSLHVYYSDNVFSSFCILMQVDGCNQVIESTTSASLTSHHGNGNTVPSTTVTTTTTKADELPFSTEQTTSPKTDKPSSTRWILIGIFGVLAILIGFTIYIIWFIYKRKKVTQKLGNLTHNYLNESSSELQLTHNERMKMFLDFDNISVDFGDVLGHGFCAIVYRAFLKGTSPLHVLHESVQTSKFNNCEAALKLPKNYDKDEITLFVRELDALIKLSPHPNIIALLGWTIHKSIPALVVEIAQTNLLAYVKDLRNQQLPLKQIFSILWQISQALEYLSTFSMVHRDVACRNVLLIDEKTAKLADFGLCCYCNETLTYKSDPHKRLPLKWLPIEALVDRIFSEKSDVWSFGVLCYEVFSYGSVPYSSIPEIDMQKFLQEGNRLEKPNETPDIVYDLMLNCWKDAPEDRPTVNEIGSVFRVLLEKETSGYGYIIKEI